MTRSNMLAFHEQWRVHGCKATSDEEKMCLQQIGGLDSTLCQGEYELTAMKDQWPVVSTNIPASEMVNRVSSILMEPRRPHITTIVTVSWMMGSVSIQSAATYRVS